MNRTATIRAILAVSAAWSGLPTFGADDGDALFIVNGRPVPRQKVVDLLMETHGVQIMQQLIALELVKAETQRRGIQVTPGDVETQFRRAVEEIAPERDAAGVALTDADKQRALEKVLQDKCLTLPEFRIAMERNAHLRKLVEHDFQVDEPTLREEFARTHGEKVELRIISLRANDRQTLQAVLDRLGRKEDFAEVARQASADADSAARGGLLEPFAFVDQRIPAAIRDVAFSLRVGEVSSPTIVGEMIHIMRLERRVPPSNVRFEDVRGEVEARLRDRVARQRMNELMTRLFDQAADQGCIRVLDPRLKREFEDLRKQRSGQPAAAP